MIKNSQFLQFQCNPLPQRDRGLFLAKGYTGYTDLHNFPQWIFTTSNFTIFYFTLCKVFVFLCFLCNFNCSAQAQTGLHWNFFLCNRKAKNQRYPKPSNGYTGIEALCNLLLIKKQIKKYVRK